MTRCLPRCGGRLPAPQGRCRSNIKMACPSVGAPKFLLLSPRGASGDRDDEGVESRPGLSPGVAVPFLPAAGSRTQVPPRLAPANRDRGRRAHPAPSEV
ncbi:hypothetical protein NDU88_000724 [Pleurodeles waltl]|uniref:Uncharacterized protein n=1 Tax=Pleurodeles waltl TaxID=8319 RepID=A0AAV7U6C9_PLEWA|nr:hypothetical protein NDU88_000724 [Pleurodeles waltl]